MRRRKIIVHGSANTARTPTDESGKHPHIMPSLEPYATERADEDAALLRLQRYARRRHQRLRSRRVDLPVVVASPYGEQRLLVPSKPVKNLLRRNERACRIIQSHARARCSEPRPGWLE